MKKKYPTLPQKKGKEFSEEENGLLLQFDAVKVVEKMIERGTVGIDVLHGIVTISLIAHVELLDMPDSPGFDDSVLYHRYCTMFRQYINFYRGVHLGHTLRRIESGDFDDMDVSGEKILQVVKEPPYPTPYPQELIAHRMAMTDFSRKKWRPLEAEDTLTLLVVDDGGDMIQVVKEVLHPTQKISFHDVVKKNASEVS